MKSVQILSEQNSPRDPLVVSDIRLKTLEDSYHDRAVSRKSVAGLPEVHHSSVEFGQSCEGLSMSSLRRQHSIIRLYISREAALAIGQKDGRIARGFARKVGYRSQTRKG